MTDPIDKHLTTAAVELLERLERALKPDCGAVVLLYNKRGVDVDLTVAVLNGDRSEEIRLLQAAMTQLLAEESSKAAYVERYKPPAVDPAEPPAQQLVTSLMVARTPRHDVVRVWNRGAHAGDLILERGDGEQLAARLGLEVE